jgi:amino acid transporter
LQGFMQAISNVADRVGIPSVAPVMALIVTISSVGGVGAWFAAASRIPFAVGLDHFLPSAYARLHPRWGTPHVALTTQAAVAAVFILLGQAGTTVRGAYEVHVSMGIITYFIPYLFMFAAMIKLQNEPAGPRVMRVPGGKPAAIFFSCLGFSSTAISIVIAAIPPDAEPNKPLAVLKIVGLNVLMVAIGAVFYVTRKRRT